MKFQLVSEFQPSGDQPQAIQKLVDGIEQNLPAQTLLGVTGSGKTFTMANVIQAVQKPTLIISHNKTLVAQLYGEFKQFFPKNAVEYFVSYYDYYQPEAYIPSSNVYIEKDLQINEEIEKLRLKTTSSLLSGRRDVVVLASVSCIYGAGNPNDYEDSIIRLEKGQIIARDAVLYALVESLYSRTTAQFERGNFRVNGDTVDVHLAYEDLGIRISFFGNEIEEIQSFDPQSGLTIQNYEHIAIFPANLFVTPRDRLQNVIKEIQDDLVAQTQYFNDLGKFLESKRLEERTNFDLEMMRELGYCSGIENYSRYFDRRNPGERPFCLLDYFPKDFLLIVDESHVTIPQVRGMFGGDRARKQNLVEYGFRLPAAIDNRPLKFEEFETMTPQTVYVSATPADYEIQKSEGLIVEQIIRPTGLLDPPIDVRPCGNQVEDLLEEIDETAKKGDRVLVTTLTKRMAEELHKYLRKLNIKSGYIHSEIKTLDRVEILRSLRLGDIDVLVGVNLLREGLDLPEVSLVAILDADKEGFLRSERSLTQTIGRAARNADGRVIMYADEITESIQKTIDETNRRREIQTQYNDEKGIVPKTVRKTKNEIFEQTRVVEEHKPLKERRKYKLQEEKLSQVADPVTDLLSPNDLEKAIEHTRKKMMLAAKEMDFMEAARLRDEMFRLEKKRPSN
ncbi:MAG: excinuclease ABC subunit B [Bacteroidetes bacterium MED-G17]|jgi:excinuclease ABC subunit B|nr:MAG: excinuclease ABC subunit B [Bacteroidetes bacterium TMED39]PDH53215.1 MAG: excinuclease ABC subunit B [Bacteroidetes bacterium MED-G17]|tara:strand:- start:10016 stop:12046 length:2031 start_codon:yes stop_codon:yes gene_type:complete